jgi:hypothetical protein
LPAVKAPTQRRERPRVTPKQALRSQAWTVLARMSLALAVVALFAVWPPRGGDSPAVRGGSPPGLEGLGADRAVTVPLGTRFSRD